MVCVRLLYWPGTETVTATVTKESRNLVEDFPYRIYPRGWYRVAWSFELADQPLPIDYFEHKFVAFRASDGSAHVLDAYCPHLGAHLGYGGTVENDELVCPFHGWQWDTKGCNTRIPYEEGTRRTKIRTWHTREIAGAVLIWWSYDDREPEWEPERIVEEESPDFHVIGPDTSILWERKHLIPQALTENLGDPAHVKYIHLSKSVPEIHTFEEDWKFVSEQDYLFGEGRASTWLTPEGPRRVHLVAEAHGLGYAVSRYTNLHGAVHLLGATPVDLRHSDVWASAVVPRSDDDLDGGLGAWGSRLVKEMFKSHEQDFPVWENMKYIEHPPYARIESSSHAPLRRWARRFYE